jgi:hypothetical protein
MTREYKLPPTEKLATSEELEKGDILFRVYEGSELEKDKCPIKLGSLEKQAFSYLGNWHLFMNKKGYGLAHRLGTKENILDSDGDLATLFLHFYSPIAKRELKMTKEIVDKQVELLRRNINTFTMKAQETYGSVISICTNPPEWMFKELNEMNEIK